MKRFITIIIFIIIITFFAKSWWEGQFAPVSANKDTQVFIIAKGAGVSEIARGLKADNLIKSKLAFKIYVRQNNLTNKLQAGSYKLSSSMSTPEIIRTLQTGSEDIWITLIEGWRVEEIAAEINSKFQIPNSKFLELTEEGYMFPDTYLFPKEATAGYIAETLRDTFDSRFTPELRSKIRSQGLTEAEGVILASIVEREARSDEVRQMVASILLKRLKIDMPLNADATVQYALGFQEKEKSWWKRNLTFDDLKVDSLYNTYLHTGLPPAPISNPSVSSLKAVANADSSTSYLYYFHDSKGNSYYAKTLDEHNRNVSKYR